MQIHRKVNIKLILKSMHVFHFILEMFALSMGLHERLYRLSNDLLLRYILIIISSYLNGDLYLMALNTLQHVST